MPNSNSQSTSNLFPLGYVVTTPNALAILTPQEISEGLERHARGDWGHVSAESIEENNESIENGSRVMSVFGNGRKRFWIITEADRSVTTVLMPADY